MILFPFELQKKQSAQSVGWEGKKPIEKGKEEWGGKTEEEIK